MLSDMIAAYVYAANAKEKDRAERNCRRLGIDKATLEIMAAEYVNDLGISVTETEGGDDHEGTFVPYDP